MIKNRLLLGSVAFGVSFSLSLLVNRDIKTALSTGLITVPATFCGVVAGNRKQRTDQKPTLNALQTQIHQLERRERELNQSLYAIAAEKQRTEVNLNVLKTELNQLYIQIAEQRSYKQQLSQDLITLGEHTRQLEAESRDLLPQIQDLEKRRRELHQSLQTIKAQKQKAEAQQISVPAELKQLQVQLAERQNQKQELERDLAFLNNLKLQLEEKTHNLLPQIQELEEKKAELNQSLSVIVATSQETENSVSYWQAEIIKLQNKGADQQNNKKKIEHKLVNFDKKEADEKLPDEWTEFMTRLPEYEVQVLKALVEQGNPRAKIKKIAEKNMTMPEVLIELINERALTNIGDAIVEPGNGVFPPVIPEEYLTNVKKVIKIKK